MDETIAQEMQLPMSERDLDHCFEYNSDKVRSDMIKVASCDADILAPYLTHFDEQAKQRLADLKVQNLQECRQLSTNTLT